MPQSGKVHLTTPNHYSCLLGTVCGPGWNHKLSFWKGSNQRMPQLGFHSCQRLSLPLSAGSVSSESTYNDINYWSFLNSLFNLLHPQPPHRKHTLPETTTDIPTLSHTSLKGIFLQAAQVLNSTYLCGLMLCVLWSSCCYAWTTKKSEMNLNEVYSLQVAYNNATPSIIFRTIFLKRN